MMAQELADTIGHDTLAALPKGPGLDPFIGWVLVLLAMVVMMIGVVWAGTNLTKWASE